MAIIDISAYTSRPLKRAKGSKPPKRDLTPYVPPRANKDRPSALYDLDNDVGEKQDIIKSHPKVVERLNGHLKAFAKDIANNSRPAAFVDNPKPLSK